MSRSFTNNAANYLTAGFSELVDQDWSMACYFKATSDVNGIPCSIADSALPSEPRWGPRYGISGAKITSFTEFGNTAEQFHSTGDVTEDVWWLVLITYAASDGDLNIYNNSATADNFTYTGTVSTGSFDRLGIGAIVDSSVGSPWDGLVAQFALWAGLELAASDMTSLLAATTTAAFGAVQSGSMLCHYPMDDANLADETGTLSDLSITGTVPSDTDDPFAPLAGAGLSQIGTYGMNTLTGGFRK